MKKLLIISILALLVLPILAQAQIEPKIKTLVFVGKGIAVSPDDPLDFKMVKAGIGTVEVALAGETTELRVGLLVLDDERYKLKDIVTDEDGGVSGNVYKDDSQVGSFSVSSIMKGDIEVWAGNSEVNDESYHLYVLEAPRRIKPIELKEKVADYCKANKDDPNCRERIANYCQNNPTDAKCKEIFRKHCKNNLDDSRCREYIKSYCDENPEIKDCRVFVAKRTAKFCREHPDSELCVKIEKELVEWCLKNPQTEKCRSFCAENPNKCLKVVKNLADFCIENADQVDCIAYCKKHPKACVKLTKNLADLCIKAPDSEKCIDYCKEHPVACKKVTAELAQFCIGRGDNPRCVNYCKEHSNACKRVSVELEGYCSKHPDTTECKEFCKRFPRKCKTVKPVVAKIEPLKAKAVAIQRLRPITEQVATTAGGE